MGKLGFSKTVGWALVLLFPVSMLAADPDAAMLYSYGGAWLNGSQVPRSTAIFAGDLVQTRSDSVANINATGSSITVLSDSLVQFEGANLKIEHGGVAVSTSKAIATTAGDVKIAPASSSWTQFDVTDVEGTVKIAARKGDLLISDEKGTVTLSQGLETTRDDASDQSDKNNKKKKKRAAGAAPAAGGGVLNSPVAIAIGAGAIGALTTWVLIKSDNPTSPSKP